MKMRNKRRERAVTLIVLGATGDLMARKIVPSLFHLWRRGSLAAPLRVIGFSRRDLSSEDFRKRIAEILSAHSHIKASRAEIARFARIFLYVRGVFDAPASYRALAQTLRKQDGPAASHRIFYLAVPPHLYETILTRLASSGLARSRRARWSRIIVEKPFGRDLKTAVALEELLASFFEEKQIYRIDHYLAKEMLQNILAFRFSNNLFGSWWGRALIERVDIKLLERIGVEHRGAFYDGIGALRDVGQNHLLQMLALIAMEQPARFDARAIRTQRARILETLHKPAEREVVRQTARAQYRGYRRIEGVSEDSSTETYFRAQFSLTHPAWRGVPFFTESGKRMGRPEKSITVTFRHSRPCLCPPGTHRRNTIVFSIEPRERITISLSAKKPGHAWEIEQREFVLPLRRTRARAQYTEEYEKLLLDCIMGDQTLFLSTREVRAMWRVIDPILSAWNRNLVPLRLYKSDTREAQRT
jgi:glucose-6-phosphate 1-dehydrogenase